MFFVVTKQAILSQPDLFRTPTKWFLNLNPSRPEAQRCHSIAAALKTETEETLKVAALRNAQFHYHIECRHLLRLNLSALFLPLPLPSSAPRENTRIISTAAILDEFLFFFVCVGGNLPLLFFFTVLLQLLQN